LYFTVTIYTGNAIIFTSFKLNSKMYNNNSNTIDSFDESSAYDLISRHAVAQVSLKICKFCFKFLKELSEC
jgi:hypothetical protein